MERRTLEGLRVGLSAGGSEAESGRMGFTPAGLNRLTVRFSQGLLAEGARLVFGHDWREAGIMRAVAGAALDYRDPESLQPSILNLVPWPDTSQADPELLERLSDVLHVERAGLPPDLQSQEQELRQRNERGEKEPGIRLYLRARGLTWLRQRLTAASDARVLIGGKTSGFEGRYPGLVEEALLALQAGQPIYLVGLLGGLAEILGSVAAGREIAIPEDFGVPKNAERLRGLLEERGELGDTSASDPMGLRSVWATVVRSTHEALFSGEDRNGLTSQENLELLTTTLEEQALYLVLKGLRKVAPRIQRAPDGRR